MMLVLKDALRPSSTVRLGRNEGGKFSGPQFALGSVEKYQRCHKYFPQYSTFTSERLQVRTQGPQTCFLFRAPSILVTTLVWDV